MADAEDGLQFLEGRVGMLFDVDLKFLRVEFPPMTPAGFGCQRSRLGGGQITIDGAATEAKAPGGFDFGSAFVDEFHHPFTQVNAIGFHAHKPIRLCANVNMNCYSCLPSCDGGECLFPFNLRPADAVCSQPLEF
jgi:hypothetical protein